MKLGPKQQAAVELLKTTDKKQGRSYLYDGECYCVIGLLAESLGWKPVVPTFPLSIHEQEYIDAYIQVFKQLKLRNTRSLWELNDDKELTFAEIAERIESDPDKFFTEPV